MKVPLTKKVKTDTSCLFCQQITSKLNFAAVGKDHSDNKHIYLDFTDANLDKEFLMLLFHQDWWSFQSFLTLPKIALKMQFEDLGHSQFTHTSRLILSGLFSFFLCYPVQLTTCRISWQLFLECARHTGADLIVDLFNYSRPSVFIQAFLNKDETKTGCEQTVQHLLNLTLWVVGVFCSSLWQC